MTDLVAGVDGCKRGWVAVVLFDGRFREARLLDGVDSTFAELTDVQRSRSTSRSVGRGTEPVEQVDRGDQHDDDHADHDGNPDYVPSVARSRTVEP